MMMMMMMDIDYYGFYSKKKEEKWKFVLFHKHNLRVSSLKKKRGFKRRKKKKKIHPVCVCVSFDICQDLSVIYSFIWVSTNGDEGNKKIHCFLWQNMLELKKTTKPSRIIINHKTIKWLVWLMILYSICVCMFVCVGGWMRLWLCI